LSRQYTRPLRHPRRRPAQQSQPSPKCHHPNGQHLGPSSNLRPAIQQARQLLQQTNHQQRTTSKWRDQVLRWLLLLDPRYGYSNHAHTVEWINLTNELWHTWLDKYHHSLLECLETLDVQKETLQPADLLVQRCHRYIDIWYRLAKQTSPPTGIRTTGRLSAEELVQLLGRLGQAYSRLRAHDKAAASAGFVTIRRHCRLHDPRTARVELLAKAPTPQYSKKMHHHHCCSIGQWPLAESCAIYQRCALGGICCSIQSFTRSCCRPWSVPNQPLPATALEKTTTMGAGLPRSIIMI
jgi:hypothetical protein